MAQDNVNATERREERSSADVLLFSQRFFPLVQSFSAYVALINSALPPNATPISLVSSELDADHPSYVRLAERVLIGWPSGKPSDCDSTASIPSVPDGVAEGLSVRPGLISLDDVIAGVIVRTLKRYPNGYSAQTNNALCCGFALARPGGPGSVFRDLDARASSGAVNALRSPPWRRLLERIGHVAARHLLTHAALLVPVLSKDTASKTGSSISLIQLCGPMLQREMISKTERSSRSISLKQDILYHGHIHQTGCDRAEALVRGEDQVVPVKRRLLNPGLPSTHPMQNLDPNDAQESSRFLFHSMFPSISAQIRREDQRRKRRRIDAGSEEGPRVVDSTRQGTGLWAPPRMRAVLPLLADVVKRASKRSFRCVLADACPLAAESNPSRAKKSRTAKELVKLETRPSQVVSFLVRVLRQVLPLDMFGTVHNRHLFESSIRALVSQRTQFEMFAADNFFAQRGPKLADIPWLHRCGTNGRKVCNPTDLRFRGDRLKELFGWIFRGLCLPLLRHNFYVSESESSRHRVVFYRREVWTAITDAVFRVMLKSDRRQFDILSRSALASSMRQRGKVIASLGSSFCPFPVFVFADVRFLPKSSGARGIQRPRGKLFKAFHDAPESRSAAAIRSKLSRMSAAQVVDRAKFSMKQFCTNALEVLRSESRARSEILGASVFSNDDIYKRYGQMSAKWRARGRPQMFFACMDIARSFDTIPLGPLFETVIPGILRQERYIVLRYVVVKRNMASSQLISRFRYHVCQEPGEESHFPRLVRNKLGPLNPGALFVDLVSVAVTGKNDLLSALKEVLSNNVVAIPRRVRKRPSTAYAVQCQGLPQGSQLSSILTSLFYGHVERIDLSPFLQDNALLPSESLGPHAAELESLQLFMRQIDDTLYASSDRSKAKQLAQRMTKGWDDEHGYTINPTKTRSNFDAGVGGVTNMRFIPWCGYIVDTKTLEVRGDYDRYVSRDIRMRDTLSIEFGAGAMETFRRKASLCFFPKLHALLLDGNINSRTTIALNLYQAATLSTLKLCSYAWELLPSKANGSDPSTPRSFLAIVEQMVENFGLITRQAVRNSVARHMGCAFPLPDRDVTFLVCRAFHDVISLRLDRWYVHLTLTTLDQRLGRMRITTGRHVVDLEERYAPALRPSASPALWNVRL